MAQVSRASGKEYQFDPYRKLKNMRLTDDEKQGMLYALMNLVEPKAAVAPELDTVGQHVEAAQVMVDQWGKMQGISSGYKGIDRLTHGFVGGELIVLGGYTSRGKTQLAINVAHRVAMAGVPVLFITLEMTKVTLTSRFMKLGVGADTPIFFQSAEVVEAGDVEGLVAKAVSDGCGLVIIDHLHYFARGSDLLGAVGEVTRDFKRMAVKYDLPVLLLSQLRRPERTGKASSLAVPRLSELKESGYIEQDADIVLMVHRAAREDDPSADLTTDYNEVTVAQRKNRNRGMQGNQLAVLRHDPESGVLLYEERTSISA